MVELPLIVCLEWRSLRGLFQKNRLQISEWGDIFQLLQEYLPVDHHHVAYEKQTGNHINIKQNRKLTPFFFFFFLGREALPSCCNGKLTRLVPQDLKKFSQINKQTTSHLLRQQQIMTISKTNNKIPQTEARTITNNHILAERKSDAQNQLMALIKTKVFHETL